jgi:SAM-dependent methyltransferase
MDEGGAIFEYRGDLYPGYLRDGTRCSSSLPTATQFCKGTWVSMSARAVAVPGAQPVELRDGGDAMDLPEGEFDYIVSSHCLEHLANPVAAIEHWKTRLKPGGVLFLYLPHPSQKYWRPANCRKHLHIFHPEDTADMLRDLGFVNVIHGERDLAWSFACVGFNG